MPDHQRLWLKTLSTMWYHVDGNPSHPLNHGVRYMAGKHCGASIINTARSPGGKDCRLAVEELINRNLVWRTGQPFAQALCVFARATRDIPRHKQILTFYANDPLHAGNLLPF